MTSSPEKKAAAKAAAAQKKRDREKARYAMYDSVVHFNFYQSTHCAHRNKGTLGKKHQLDKAFKRYNEAKKRWEEQIKFFNEVIQFTDDRVLCVYYSAAIQLYV